MGGLAVPKLSLPLWVAVQAALLVGCGGAGKSATSGPCGPCQRAESARGAGSSEGLEGVGLPRSPKLEALAKRRVELAQQHLVQLRAGWDKGATTMQELFTGCRDVAFAARDSGLRGQALRDVLEQYVGAVTALRDVLRERVANGGLNSTEVTRVDELVAEAEFWLEEAKTGP
jgi:hypothetical protein